MLFAGLWKHEAATFRYVFPGDETFHLLEGRVRIEVDGMPSVELQPGDIVSFPKGSSSTWTIHEEMTKFYDNIGCEFFRVGLLFTAIAVPG
ncbi:MAG: cupin domain-containing protein, partial [Planctomyces sp.]